MFKKILLVVLSCFCLTAANAEKSANSIQARKIFDQTYDMVFGEEGSSLHYAVNIIGIMKVNGTIWLKGKKSRFEESRYLSWNDGVKDYRVDKKKKTVTLYDAKSEAKDKYGSKFKFNANDYDYSISNCREGYEITLDAHKGVKGIKHAKAIIDKKTHAPLFLKIKVLWFWTTVNITHFKSGDISDDTFKFPAEKFKGYPFKDKRGK